MKALLLTALFATSTAHALDGATGPSSQATLKGLKAPPSCAQAREKANAEYGTCLGNITADGLDYVKVDKCMTKSMQTIPLNCMSKADFQDHCFVRFISSGAVSVEEAETACY